MTVRRPRRAWVAVAASALLCACTGSLFQSKAVPSSIYLLSVQPDGPHVSAGVTGTLAADLAVLRPRVRRGLESDRIAVLYPDRRLDFFADARWSGPLDEVLQDLVVQAFRSQARLRNVGADASAFGSGYWLEIEVADFQAEYAAAPAAPLIHVRLLARLGGAGDRRILASFDASARQAAAGNRLTAIVAAYEQAVDAALQDLVSNTTRAIGASLDAAR